MRQPGFQPFYDRITLRLPGPSPIIWKVFFSALLGLSFLVAHFRTVGAPMFGDWSWLLSVLITSSLLLLYYATHTLRALLPQMDRRLNKKGEEYYREQQFYFVTLKRTLGDGRFVVAGLLFGTLNCLLGYKFGVPYLEARGRATIFAGFFVVGFICGMAALGIYGVLDTVKAFMRAENIGLDYSAPDGSGGTLFLGEALVKFGSVTLTMGVLIALFIVNFGWIGDSYFVKALRWFWIAFPFAASLLVVLAPSAEINRILSEYKVDKEEQLDDKLAELRTLCDDPNTAATEREAARQDYEYYNKLRAKVYKMRTWPYNVSSSLQYGGIFIGNATAIAWQAIEKMVVPE